MRLTKLYVRFFKSFNYDYERKSNPDSQPQDWERIEEMWFPYVRIGFDPSVTTIVGANESGKTHLLDAIQQLITGSDLDASDFCRYSSLFSVQRGKRRTPDIGGDFELSTETDVERTQTHLGVDLQVGDRLRLLRQSDQAPSIGIAGRDATESIKATNDALVHVLPTVFRVDATVPLPASIPLYELFPEAPSPYGSRRSRHDLLMRVFRTSWQNETEFTQAAPELYKLLSSDPSSNSGHHVAKQYDLARSLLFDVAQIDPTTFQDLANAIADGREGYANGLFQRINDSLARHLNFPRWWAQDRDFKLLTSPREHDLVFTIRDRTGTDYSFSERSNGLRYFLSYHVQLLAHRAPREEQSEILLMDEPDAYLSNQGQQDLLKILERFARPEDGGRRSQVVYVTHSPFLINRNAGHRVRVLDKGRTDEGTRVVSDVARNHYEPLRSSLGVFAAETSFIGGANLFVEGLADQVLLAGLNSYLVGRPASRTALLDLNDVTIVPAGSAGSVPYLVYLAMGRDQLRPPCVVLLDSDEAGNDAAKALAKGGARRRQLISDDNVVQIGSWVNANELLVDDGVVVTELEDLIPIALATEAARSYAAKVIGLSDHDTQELRADHVSAQLPHNKGSLFDALSQAFSERWGDQCHIEKVGFAKEVLAVLEVSHGAEAAALIVARFEPLLGHLAKRLRAAHVAEQERRWGNRVARAVDGFLLDYPTTTTRERARGFTEEVEGAADDSPEGDRIRSLAAGLRRDFDLNEELAEPVPRYGEFLVRVKALHYAGRLLEREIHGISGRTSDGVDGTGTTPVAGLSGRAGPARKGRKSKESPSKSVSVPDADV